MPYPVMLLILGSWIRIILFKVVDLKRFKAKLKTWLPYMTWFKTTIRGNCGECAAWWVFLLLKWDACFFHAYHMLHNEDIRCWRSICWLYKSDDKLALLIVSIQIAEYTFVSYRFKDGSPDMRREGSRCVEFPCIASLPSVVMPLYAEAHCNNGQP